MKKIIVGLSMILISTTSFACSLTGTVTGIMSDSDGNVFVYTNSPPVDCKCGNPSSNVAFSLNDKMGKAWYMAAIAARMAGKTIYAQSVDGTCLSVYPRIGIGGYFQIN